MENLHHNTGANWPPVDYSLNRNTVTLSNFDTSGSIILNVGPSQTMQLVPSAAHSSSVSQMIHQQSPNIIHPVSHNHHQQQSQMHNTSNAVQSVQHTMLSTNPMGHSSATQLQVGQLLPTILQPSPTAGMLVTNQHVAPNMIWQNNAPHPAPPLPQQMQQAQLSGNLVNVAVQTGIAEESTRNQNDKFQSNNELKLPAKKRHNKLGNEEGVSDKKKGKYASDKKKSASGNNKSKKKSSEKSEIKRKRACNPKAWKKNVRKMMRVQGKGYINTKGVYVPPKTRTGPPCSCRMRCYESIPEVECNEIFDRFLKIGDKDIQDALLYSLITKEEPKHRRSTIPKGDDQRTSTNEPGAKQNIRNATFLYHVQCKEGIMRICSSAFMSIYGATQKRIRRLQQHKFIDPLNPPKDLRGKHGNQKIIGMLKAKKRHNRESGENSAINLVKKLRGKSGKSQPINRNQERFNQRPPEDTTVSLQQLQATQHHNPVDYSVWQNVSETHTQPTGNSQHCIVSNPMQHHSSTQPQLTETHSDAVVPLSVEMTTLDSSGFLSGFLLGASGEDLKSAVAKFNASSVSCGGATTSKTSTDTTQTAEYSKHPTYNKMPDAIENLLSETGTNLVKGKHEGKEATHIFEKHVKKRSRHPELWKKNIRKNNRAHGMAYINSKGKFVPAKTRCGPPCKCRMRCYLRITEEECDTIFRDFHHIGDKNVQDGILYNLMIHKEVKHHKKSKKFGDSSDNSHIDDGSQSHQQHTDLLDLIFCNKESEGHSNAESFVRNLVNHNASNFGSVSQSQLNQSISNESDKLTHMPKLDESNLNSILNLSTSQQQNSDTSCTDNESHNKFITLKDKTKSPRDRQSTFWYYVQKNSGLVRVCSNAFMSIYGATQKRLRRLQQHKVSNPITPPKDMRGKHGSGGPVSRQLSKSVSHHKSDDPEKKKNTPSASAMPDSQTVYLPANGSQQVLLQGNGSTLWQNNIL